MPSCPTRSRCAALAIALAFTLPACSSTDDSPGSSAGHDAGADADGSAAQDASQEASSDAPVAEGCTPKTCLQLGVGCGSVDDGCGTTIDCGSCAAPETCGGGGVENQCGCTAKSCAQLGVNCGSVDTGCGPVACGDCTAPETCGGAGVENQCGCVCSLPNAQTSCSAGACQIDACDGGWADCDGNAENGCETAIDADVDNCGACGNTCSFPHATGVACDAGVCIMGGCEAGFADCDGVASNGCEANLAADPNNCQQCGNVCPAAGGTPVCVFGACSVSACSPGLGDCSATEPGCETDLLTSTSHCGFCGNECSYPRASGICDQGVCELGACDQSYGNCDASVDNGCETNIDTSLTNCGACGQVCPAVAHANTACVLGVCKNSCISPWLDCDDGLGCETNGSSDVANCGGCGQVCSSNNMLSVGCNNGVCTGTCATWYADCNNDLQADGCETEVRSDPANCGGCGWQCSGNHVLNPSCKYGSCGGTCELGWGDCNHNKLLDGCETSLNTNANCGGCGVTCGDCESCSNGICVDAPCR